MTRAFAVFVAALLAIGCASMEWPVSCSSTTVAELDQRYRDETAAEPAVIRDDGTVIIRPRPVMDRCDELAPLEDCPEFHRVWRRYWYARRALAACEAR